MSCTEAGVPRHLAEAILTIDLDAIAANWRLMRERVAPAECAAVVKADAYGTGIAEVAPALARAGCRTFFVAHVSEAVALRKILAGVPATIYTLNGIAGGAETVTALLEADIRPVLSSFEELHLWIAARGPAGLGPRAGLQFTTGMNRLGFAPGEAGAVAAVLAKAQGLGLDFVMSHFVSSEMPDEPLNARQIAAFEAIRAELPPLPASLANSSGIFLAAAPYYDLVRPGYALYGGNPTPGQRNPMRTAIRLEAPILQIRDVGAHETCGYNAIWMAQRPSRLATIGIGYADGFLRSAAAAAGKAGAVAIVGGVACPVAGRVSMDLIILDVTDAPREAARPGQAVELLGPHVGIDDLAAAAGTIGYEILTGLGRRYNRRYIAG